MPSGTMTRAGIVGGGAWGTALATVALRAGLEPLIWAREPEVVEAINTRHENTMFLPGLPLDPAIRATGELAAMAERDVVLMVTPAQALRAVAGELAASLPPGTPVVICSKGIERGSGKLMSEVLAEVLPQATGMILSGPSFAREVAGGLPTAVTLACGDIAAAATVAAALSSPTFRPYTSDDVLGAEIGGAVKNVLAIACGIVEGRGLGESARAALTTRGFAELVRFGTARGARPETLHGLSGLGDLVLTCTSSQSRNMSLGIAIGKGRSAAEVLEARTSVSEGAYTAAVVVDLAGRLGVEMPICAAVRDILDGRLDVDAAVDALLRRPLKREE